MITLLWYYVCMAKAGKSGIFEKSPNAQTIKFAGKYINISALARAQGLDVSYLSRIFNGHRVPTLGYCVKMAAMLGLTLDNFVEALEDRAREKQNGDAAILNLHNSRIEKEDKADLAAFTRGQAVAPRLPATRRIE